MGLVLVTTFAAFFFVRRYSLRHPEELDKIVSNRTMFQVHEESTEWETVGFHRPLSGFLVALSIGLILFIPPYCLSKFDPANIHPALGPGSGYLGAGDPVLQPGLDLLRHGYQHRVHQISVRAPGQGSEEGHPIWTGICLVASSFWSSAGCIGNCPCNHTSAAFSLCSVCLERDHPFIHPDPRFLPGHETCIDRFPASRLQSCARGWP